MFLKLVAVLMIAIVSLIIGWQLNGRLSKQSADNQPSAEFSLLANRIQVDNPNEIIINFTDLRASLKKYYSENNLEGSLYFEYLPTGTSIRVDGDNPQVAASLMKLPVAMLLYKTAEDGKINLDKEITLKSEWLNSDYGSLYKKGAGHKLTLREAAKIMLVESDNTALTAITMSLESVAVDADNPLSFLDLDYKQNQDSTVSISARSYASFLKCLYLSCYLNPHDSQEILTNLSVTKFNTRLRSGIPNNITVAHKVGSFGDQSQSDCGIIYLNKRNYLLCVMVNGPENSITDKHIATLSRLVFDYVDNASRH